MTYAEHISKVANLDPATRKITSVICIGLSRKPDKKTVDYEWEQEDVSEFYKQPKILHAVEITGVTSKSDAQLKEIGNLKKSFRLFSF